MPLLLCHARTNGEETEAYVAIWYKELPTKFILNEIPNL